MIDIDLFKQILSSDNRFIDENDIINNKFIDKLKEFSATKILSLFKKGEYKIHCQFVCSCCQKVNDLFLSKTKLQDYIKKQNFICEKCLQIKREQEQKEKEIEHQQYLANKEITLKENTNNFINIYLNPDCSWKNNLNVKEKFKRLKNNYENTNKEDIINYIIDMEYQDFLKTPYWIAISQKIKLNSNFKCQLCNSTNNLITHHRTYNNHGLEIEHLEDLICICQDCHEHFHFN